MKLSNKELKSKLDRLVENTQIMINAIHTTNTVKSVYNSIKDDWQSLDGVLDTWKQISFTSNDFHYDDNLCYEKITETCKTNMQRIKGICNDALANINEPSSPIVPQPPIIKYKIMPNTCIAIISVIIAICGIAIGAISSIRFAQGKTEGHLEMQEIVNTQANELTALSDSLSEYKRKLKSTETLYTKCKRLFK